MTAPKQAAVRHVLAEFGVSPADAETLVEAAPGFSGARVWRLDSSTNPLALRATPEPAVAIERLLGLHRLLIAVVQRTGLPLPVPLRDCRGGTFLVHVGWVWQLDPWMPGEADFHHQPTRERLVSAMHALALFHRAAAEFQPLPTERSWFFGEAQPSPGLAERAQHLKRWTSDLRNSVRASLASNAWIEFRELGMEVLRLFENHAPRVAALLDSVRDIEVPVQPCLRDVWHDHLLFTGNRLTGLIDTHACRSDCVATDLSRLLGSLLGDDRPAWDFAIQVYQEQRPLSVDERALVEVFDQSAVLLNGLTWLDWVCLRGRQFADRPRVETRLREIAGRMMRL